VANLGIYSQSQIKAARQADLVAWLQAHGHNLKSEGQNWRLPGFGGLLIQGNHFKHFSSGTGGNSLDFLINMLGMAFLDAVQTLIHTGPAQQPITAPALPMAEKELMLPQRGQNHRRVIAYQPHVRFDVAGVGNGVDDPLEGDTRLKGEKRLGLTRSVPLPRQPPTLLIMLQIRG
jgi:hypothetical protein